MPKQFLARCFGLDWRSDIELEHFDPVENVRGDFQVSLRRVEHLEPRPPLRQVGRAAIDNDGFRFAWNDEATFDFSDRALRWSPGSAWSGRLPASFYSSVAAMTAASVGLLPLHVSSIVFDDKAWLIAGKAGAGKSTLMAELLSAGGRFLADDLTILTDADGIAVANRGRSSIRLHPDTAQLVRASKIEPVPEDRRGKLLVWPVARAEDTAWRIGGVLLLGGNTVQSISEPQKAAAFGSLLFRPRISAKLPGLAERRKILLELALQVPAVRFPTAEQFGKTDRLARIRAALHVIELMSQKR